jgi:predicted NAD/FAD-dependent oxidoreductase
MKKLAVIGAGLSGLTVATRLKNDHEVTVFEKSRGVSGRMSTRNTNNYAFDHGAQYFTIQDKRFERFLKKALASKIVTPWFDQIKVLPGSKDGSSQPLDCPSSERYLASPTMTALCKHLAESINVLKERKVETLEWQDSQWLLGDQTGTIHGPFDLVVCAIPQPQFIELAGKTLLQDTALEKVQMSGCFSLMIGDPLLTLPEFAGAKVVDSPIGWIAVNSVKPGRNTAPSIIVQSTNEWAEQYLETDVNKIQEILLSELGWLTGIDYSRAKYINIHRWRYAFVKEPLGKPYYVHPDLPLAACGDWCLGARVECAYLSGFELAEAVKIGLWDEINPQ